MKNITTKNLPEAMRPYEKCLALGADALSDAELLAVIIRTGSNGVSSIELAQEILSETSPKGDLSGLFSITTARLRKFRGIGRVKAIQLLSIVELSKRMARTEAKKRLDFCSPQSIAEYYMEDFRHDTREKLMVVMLDTKLRKISDEVISTGTVNASIVSPREIFVSALKAEAVYIVLIHNHPSGDATPSQNDIEATRRILAAGKLIGIQLMDHLIIGDNTYISLKSSGYMISE